MEKWQTLETVVIWLVLFVVIFAALMIFIVLYINASTDKIQKNRKREDELKLEHQQKLLETFITTQENERNRIASDLHDDLIGKLVVMKLQLENGQKEIIDIIPVLSKAIVVARSISHDLMPALIEYEPLREIIADLVRPWKVRLNILFKHDVRIDVQETNECKIQITRIIQELIVNIEKHAQASCVHLTLRKTKKYIMLYLKDNGKGFNHSEINKGLGFNSVETRILYLGGKFKIKSNKGGGTSFLLILLTKQHEL